MSEHVPGEADRASGPRSVVQRTLDVLVFAPAGLVVTAVEDLPELSARGRTAVETTIKNAHTVGRFTVAIGQRDLKRRLGRMAEGVRSTRGGPESASMHPAPPAERGGARDAGVIHRATGPARPDEAAALGDGQMGGTSGLPAEPPVDLAIPGYEALSASQVVRRLDGLGPHELEAVYRHESGTRRRRTILHRVQQLLGPERSDEQG